MRYELLSLEILIIQIFYEFSMNIFIEIKMIF